MKEKIITIFCIILVLFAIIPNISRAKVEDDIGGWDKYKVDDVDIGKLEDKAETVVGLIRTVGIMGSVIALIAIGIKYMMGSIEEKAKYKETFKPYIIGAFLVFSVSLLPQLIYEIVKDLQ